MDKVAKQVNQGKPDPITNRKMSDACWNGRHRGQGAAACSGWVEQCGKCDRKHGVKHKGCPCDCHQNPCNCACHDPQEYKPKVKRDKNSSMHILGSGCGTIEVK